jgi:WbqC-like protein family
MKCVILQPSYIPWRGYFDQINRADVFVFYDDVQYDKHGWRNRNQIRTAQGRQWLTIPVHTGDVVKKSVPIKQVEIDWNRPWNTSHWKALTFAYRRAPFFRNYAALLESFYQRHDVYLADFTIDLTIALARELGIQHTRFIRSSELEVVGQKTGRLVQILVQLGATHYISGPSAKDYIENEKFLSAGITLEYMDYNYPEYPQLHAPFDPNLSILDLLFMTGPDALRYIVR